jgi:N-acetyltransferase 10
MHFLSISKCSVVLARASCQYYHRYEIEEGAPGWADAERQVLSATKSGQKNPVVSVKSTKTKRKAGESAAEILEQEMGEKAHKKVKKGPKKDKTRS